MWIVTGGNGFIGHHLVATLVASGRPVRVLDVRAPSGRSGDVEYVEGSVLDPSQVERALVGVDRVYHLAGLPGMWMANKQDFHDVNCRGTEIVLAAAQKRDVSRFLHCSTESILFRSSRNGDGSEDELQPADAMPGAYTRSKALAEQHARKAIAAGFPVVIGTPTMPIGPSDHNFTPPTAMLRHFLGQRVQLYLDFIVNLVDVRDVAAGLMLAMEHGRIGHRYVLGGESIRLGQILRLMTKMSGRRQFPIAVPGRFAEMGAKMLELIADHLTRKPPSGTSEGVRIALRASDLSIEKARNELGYAPRPIEPVLRDTIAHLLTLDDKRSASSLEDRRALSSRAN